MKRLYIIAAAGLCVLLCVLLAACSAVEQSRVTGYYTVTFYQNGEIIGQEQVSAGDKIQNIPQGLAWQDGTGALVDPAEFVVTQDLTFTARESAYITPAHVIYMSAENRQFDPDGAVTRGQLAEMLYALLDTSLESQVLILV